MRVPVDRRSGEIGFNMTPMIDVVFLLIIFFLVSSHLAQQESRLELPLPRAGGGSEAVVDDKPRLTVNVLSGGNIQIAGKSIDTSALRSRLESEIGSTSPDLQVRIRSHRGVPYRFVEPIMLSCARAGIWNVSLVVIRPEGAG